MLLVDLLVVKVVLELVEAADEPFFVLAQHIAHFLLLGQRAGFGIQGFGRRVEALGRKVEGIVSRVPALTCAQTETVNRLRFRVRGAALSVVANVKTLRLGFGWKIV